MFGEMVVDSSFSGETLAKPTLQNSSSIISGKMVKTSTRQDLSSVFSGKFKEFIGEMVKETVKEVKETAKETVTETVKEFIGEMVPTETDKSFKDLSLEDKLSSIFTVDNAIEKVLDLDFTKLALEAPDSLQSTIYTISSYAAAEFLQVVGIGAGFTSLNMAGFTQIIWKLQMTQINNKLDEIKAQLDKVLSAPAVLALEHFKRGMHSLEAENYAEANKEFNEVIKLAMTGVYYENEKIQTVANLTNYVIVADLMVHSFDRKKEYFQPYELLESRTKIEMKRKVTDHLEKLLDVQIRREPGYFSLSKHKKKEANQNVIDGVLQNALQFLCPPGSLVPVKFIPDGVEDAALLNLNGKPGKLDSSSIYIWRNNKKVMIRHGETGDISEIDTKEDELTIISNSSGVYRDGQALVITQQSRELIVASDNGNNSKVKALLTSGADVNLVDSGTTPLMRASYKGHNAVVTTLLKHPLIQINIQNVDGSTALHCASVNGHIAVVTKLLKHPLIQINVQDRVGNTALHVAAVMGRLNVAKQLVTAGADLTLLNENGRTPAEDAECCNKHDVYDYLRNSCAQPASTTIASMGGALWYTEEEDKEDITTRGV